MKTINQGGDYKSPRLSVIDMCTEGMLCNSDPWYMQKNVGGDFDYGITTDDTWA